MKKYKYKPRPPFLIIQRIAKYEIDEVEQLVQWAGDTRISKEQILQNLCRGNSDDDWLVDDFAELDSFSYLTAKFAIIGLWRCIELYRKRTITQTPQRNKVDNNKNFKTMLNSLGINEDNLCCSRSINELRCINNSIKHERRVGEKLADIHR